MRYCFIFALLIICSCGEKIDKRTPEEKRQYQCELTADLVTDVFCKKMLKEKGLVTIGTGGGGTGPEDQRKIRLLSVDFECYQAMSMEQVRELLVECVEKYLEEIKNKQEFQECLSLLPFTERNISIVILFLDKRKDMLKESRFMSPPSIASARADEGILKYRIYQERLESKHEETYEQALHILHSQSNSS